MKTLSYVETFERTQPIEFEIGQAYKTSKYAKHSFSLLHQGEGFCPSGIRSTNLLGVGQYVLVIGDQSSLRIDFAEKVKKVSWKFYLVVDYSEDDLKSDYPDTPVTVELNKLKPSNFDNFYSVTTISEEGTTEYFVTGTEILNEASLDPADCTALIFKTSRAGTLHLDTIRWEVDSV